MRIFGTKSTLWDWSLAEDEVTLEFESFQEELGVMVHIMWGFSFDPADVDDLEINLGWDFSWSNEFEAASSYYVAAPNADNGSAVINAVIPINEPGTHSIYAGSSVYCPSGIQVFTSISAVLGSSAPLHNIQTIGAS